MSSAPQGPPLNQNPQTISLGHAPNTTPMTQNMSSGGGGGGGGGASLTTSHHTQYQPNNLMTHNNQHHHTMQAAAAQQAVSQALSHVETGIPHHQPQNQPVEFNHAINYVNKIKVSLKKCIYLFYIKSEDICFFCLH